MPVHQNKNGAIAIARTFNTCLIYVLYIAVCLDSSDLSLIGLFVCYFKKAYSLI